MPAPATCATAAPCGTVGGDVAAALRATAPARGWRCALPALPYGCRACALLPAARMPMAATVLALAAAISLNLARTNAAAAGACSRACWRRMARQPVSVQHPPRPSIRLLLRRMARTAGWRARAPPGKRPSRCREVVVECWLCMLEDGELCLKPISLWVYCLQETPAMRKGEEMVPTASLPLPATCTLSVLYVATLPSSPVL